jgi:hypothetical protein
MGDQDLDTTFARTPQRLMACDVDSPAIALETARSPLFPCKSTPPGGRFNPGSPKMTMSHDVVTRFVHCASSYIASSG